MSETLGLILTVISLIMAVALIVFLIINWEKMTKRRAASMVFLCFLFTVIGILLVMLRGDLESWLLVVMWGSALAYTLIILSRM